MKKFIFSTLISILSTILIGFTASPSIYADVIDLSLDKAIESALTNNEDLKQAREDRESASERVKEARGAILPTLEANYGYNHYFGIQELPITVGVAPLTDNEGNLLGLDEENPPDPDNPLKWQLVTQKFPFKQKNEHSFGLTLSQVLFTSGRVSNYYRAAKAGDSGARFGYNRKKREVILQVQVAYLNALLAREAFKITRSSLQNAQYDHKIIVQKFKEGLGSEFEVMQHEVEINNRRTDRVKAENSLTLAKNHLKVVIGIPRKEKIVLKDSFNESFPDFESEEIEKKMLNSEPSLRALKHVVEVNKYLWKARKADFLPIVAAFGSFQYMGESNDFLPSGEDFYDNTLVGLTLTVPIYEGGIKGAKKNQAFRDYKKSELELAKVRKLLTLDLQNNHLSYLSSRRELDSAMKTVQLAKKAYDLARVRYQIGLGSLTELNDAELSLTKAKLRNFQIIRDVNLSLYKLQSYISSK
jgi:outer membrane protein TolC